MSSLVVEALAMVFYLFVPIFLVIIGFDIHELKSHVLRLHTMINQIEEKKNCQKENNKTNENM